MQRRIRLPGRKLSISPHYLTGKPTKFCAMPLLQQSLTVLFCALHRYKGVLHAASESIADSYGTSSGILALNLGPAWSNSDAYALFGDNVIEISFKEWESPPGLGVCPLDVIFSVCYSISSWLNLNDDHVVVNTSMTLPEVAQDCACLSIFARSIGGAIHHFASATQGSIW